MKLEIDKFAVPMDVADLMYVVLGIFVFVGGITLLIFTGSYISKSGKCKPFQSKRKVTVSNQVGYVVKCLHYNLQLKQY